MNFIGRFLLGALALVVPQLAAAQGTLPIALQQQFSFTNCATNTNACGTPLIGGLLYFYQVGTVATQQNSFQDTGLTLPNPWPLPLDANGRIPIFYLANGSVHVRLTDANGLVQFDLPSALVIGPSGGGGGAASVDPTTIAATGDLKSRLTSEFVTGWVKANAQTIGSAVSGATQRANADTQSLFTYLWTNCPDAHCPVLSGRGASGLADFNANKQLTLPDLRGRICTLVGLDDMGNTAAGRILAGNVTSGGGDTATTPNATGGEANHALSIAELAQHNHPVFLNDPGHAHSLSANNAAQNNFGGAGGGGGGGSGTATITIASNTTGITVRDTSGGGGTANQTATTGSGTPHNNMPPFMLGTCYLKL